jgi:uncharacterized protein YigE (DUF2233 family)
VPRRARLIATGAALACVAPVAAAQPPADRARWAPDSQPVRWTGADAALAATLRWTDAAPGVRWTELPVRAGGEAVRTRVVLVRLDPARVRLALDTLAPERRTRDGARVREARWTLDAAPRRALVALNAGQFAADLFGERPFGWTVLDGREWQPPGRGALASAVVVDSGGRVRIDAPGALASPGRALGVAWAFQSYPTLLEGDGAVPAMLRAGDAIDRTHRDARLAIGTTRDGTVLVALTRFDALGPALGSVPLGFTVPETAALMGALGCDRAVMLDGGISAQLLVRDARGRVERWRGWRRVPMGLVVLPRGPRGPR